MQILTLEISVKTLFSVTCQGKQVCLITRVQWASRKASFHFLPE